MSYLLDKKLKKRKILYITISIVFLISLFYFRVGLSSRLSNLSHYFFRPLLVFGNNISNGFSNAGSFFSFKKNIISENESLKKELDQINARIINYDSVLDENLKLKEILGRKREDRKMAVATILTKPNRSPYDTLIIDLGKNQEVQESQRVFALGNIPIGKISETYANSSKVILYSNPEEKTEVIVSGKDTFIEAIGRGGGNFEIILPKDFNLENGTDILLPGINSYILGTVVKTISDPRDAFGKVLIASPINIQNLKFVEVEK